MTVNLYDTANQLERELRQSEQYVALQNVFAELEKADESKRLFEEFRQLTEKFQKFQESGTQPSEEDLKAAEEVSKKAQGDALILKLVQAEQSVSVLINDLNAIITKPLSELYKTK